MEFCSKCGARLEPKKVELGNMALLMLVCSKCGQEKHKSKKSMPQVTRIIRHDPKQFVAVIGKEEQQLRTLPTIQIKCPKCENNVAYVWEVQTRGIDESSTQFCRCAKCNYTFREHT